MYTFLAQLLGIFGLGCNVISYQQKKKVTLILCQLFGGLFFSIHFFMLGDYIGAMLNAIALVRAIIFAKVIKTRSSERIWMWIFLLLCTATYPLTFTVFGVEASPFTLVLKILPVIAMCVGTVSFTMENAGKVRFLSLFNSPLWLINNIVEVSWGGILCETLSLVSIVLGIVRHDIKRNNKKGE
ncbi:MAG: YgjV family protein [Clostridia bacterium]|nr:YgjV family protein [Clostridia bacterium]